jgi:D-alanine-D-alanine ligase
MKVAVVQNRACTGVINTFGQPCPEKYGQTAVQDAVDALEGSGHEVILCEGDTTLLATLERFMPPDEQGRPSGMVFNMAYGIQGACRYTHVPAMLEMAGVPYTGSSPLGHALALDKVITKNLLRVAGIPTPTYAVMRCGTDSPGAVRFPVVVKPRHESTSFGLHLAHNRAELAAAVDAIVQRYEQPALVEEYIDGRDVCVAILGNDELEYLPIVEHEFGNREIRLVTWADKMHKAAAEPEIICPADLEGTLAATLRAIAGATFRACCCQDYARVDLRVDARGIPHVLEINSMASLGRNGSFVRAARMSGYSIAALVNHILDIAHQRYFGQPIPCG